MIADDFASLLMKDLHTNIFTKLTKHAPSTFQNITDLSVFLIYYKYGYPSSYSDGIKACAFSKNDIRNLNA